MSEQIDHNADLSLLRPRLEEQLVRQVALREERQVALGVSQRTAVRYLARLTKAGLVAPIRQFVSRGKSPGKRDIFTAFSLPPHPV